MELLREIYTSLDSPGGFSGVSNLLREAKKRDPTVTRKDVQAFFETQRVDLGVFPNLSKHNHGYQYILVGVDVMSRLMFGVPLKTKSAEEIKRGFEELFKQTPKLPMRVYSDRGKEFMSSHIKEYFKEKGVEKIESFGGDTKAAVAERALRTIKGRVYRYFSEKNTHNWVQALPKVLDAINHSVCRVTQMRPVDINQNNWKPLWDKLYGPCFEDGGRPARFKAGDHVRIDMHQEKFGRGFHTQYSDEIFTIAKAKPGGPQRPSYYKLVDRKGTEIKGVFYNENLVKTRGYDEMTHRIAKVHRTRTRRGTKELLVSWSGHPESEQTWIKESDLVS